MNSCHLFQTTFDIIKIISTFIKTAFKDSKQKSLKNEELCIKMQFVSVSLVKMKVANFGEKNLISAEIESAPHDLYIF